MMQVCDKWRVGIVAIYNRRVFLTRVRFFHDPIIHSTVIIIAGDEEMPIADFVVAEAAMYASFPDMTLEYDTANVTDGVGDGIAAIDAVVSGTFTGADYVVGDKPAIVATGAAVSKETKFAFTYENEKITKLVIVGLDPIAVYEEVAVTD